MGSEKAHLQIVIYEERRADGEMSPAMGFEHAQNLKRMAEMKWSDDVDWRTNWNLTLTFPDRDIVV